MQALCRLCRQPLSELRRRLADTCEAPACRHQVALASQRRQRELQLSLRVAQAAGRGAGPAITSAPVVWLQYHATRLVTLDPQAARAHAEHLARLAAEPEAHPRDPNLAGFAEDDPPAAAEDSAVDAKVCGLCRGRCCRMGRAHHGFVDVGLLRRWQARQGGSLFDAAAHYVARLPARHIEASCLYHGVRGCVLQRDERAPVCNGWACDALLAARQQLQAAPALGAVLAAQDRSEVPAAAWLHVTARRRVRLQPLPTPPDSQAGPA